MNAQTRAHFPYDLTNLEPIRKPNNNLSFTFSNKRPPYIKFHTTHTVLCELLAVLPVNTACYTYQSSTVIDILIDIPWTDIRQDRRLISYLGCLYAVPESASSPFSSRGAYLSNQGTTWKFHHSFKTHNFILGLSQFIHHYSSISTMP